MATSLEDKLARLQRDRRTTVVLLMAEEMKRRELRPTPIALSPARSRRF